MVGIEKAQVKIDSVPYEQFPYCCSTKNVLKNEIDMAKMKGIAPIKKQSPVEIKVTPVPKKEPPRAQPQPFWTNVVI